MAAVDCSQASSRKVCEQHAVRSFPTLKLFGSDLKPNPYTGEPMKDLEDYRGEGRRGWVGCRVWVDKRTKGNMRLGNADLIVRVWCVWMLVAHSPLHA